MVSTTDGKIALNTMDPDVAKGGYMGMLWDLLLVGVVCFFLLSIINQFAAAKAAELRSAKKAKKA